MAKTFFFYFYNVLGRTSLCFTDQETQEENVAGGPTPVDQVLHRLSLVQGSRSNQRMQTVQWPRQVSFVSVLGRASFAL